MNTIITRKTKLGFGYNAELLPEDGYIRPPKGPSITGTIKTLREKIETNTDYQNFVQNNPYHIISWFVCVNGKWRLINADHYGFRLLWYDDALCDKMCNMSKISVALLD